MELPNLKELKSLIALCRKTGVKVVKVGNLELTLADHAPTAHKRGKPPSNEPSEASEAIPSAEEMLFWSTQDVPADLAKPDTGN